jgi:hypothetical protein
MARKSNGILSFDTYKLDEKASTVERTANALDWAANHYPKQLVPYNILLKAIMGYGFLPRLNSSAVVDLRSTMSRVKKTLRIKYGKGLVSEPGAGVRATVDSADQLRTDVRRAASRHHSSGKALAAAASLVDMSEVPNTPENKKLIQWAKTGLKEQLAQIDSPEFKKLLEPIADADDKA